MTLTPEIHRSLTEAGIGRIYHEKTLSECGDLGRGYEDWIKTAGPRLKRDGGLVVMMGQGQSAVLPVLARGFHMNGAGVRIKTLSQLYSILRTPGERREDLEEAPCLFVSPAQAGRRICPLDGWAMDTVTAYLRERVERGQITVLYWAHDREFDVDDPLWSWWDVDFLDWASETGEILRAREIMARGQK